MKNRKFKVFITAFVAEEGQTVKADMPSREFVKSNWSSSLAEAKKKAIAEVRAKLGGRGQLQITRTYDVTPLDNSLGSRFQDTFSKMRAMVAKEEVCL